MTILFKSAFSDQIRQRRVLCIILVMIIFCFSLISINTNQQLGRMSGMTEEYIDVGRNLLEYGTFTPHKDVIFLWRPPGYIFYVAAILSVPQHIPRLKGANLELAKKRVTMNKYWGTSPFFRFEKSLIYFSQAFLLGLSSMFLFLLFARFSSIRMAFLLALAYGINVYLVILTGLLHYPIFHLFMVILSIYLTVRAFENDSFSKTKIFLAGLSWGTATLVRPMTLLLPAFIFLAAAFIYRGSWKKIILSTLILTAGIILMVAPYTLRNYIVSGRFIPVNAQSWSVFWSNTIERKEYSPNHFNWWNMWYTDGMKIYERVVGDPEYSFLQILIHNLELEDAFKEASIRNLSQQPDVFISNTWDNFRYFNLRINSIFIKIFQGIQLPSGFIDMKEWVAPGHPQQFHDSKAKQIFEVFISFLTLLSFCGIILGLRNKNELICIVFFVYCCFCLAHSLTIIHLMHYYIKMPFLYLFSGYFLSQCAQRKALKTSLGAVILSVIFITELYLIAVVL